MNDSPKGGIDALLAAARAEYGTRLVAKVAEIADFASRGDWSETRRAAHKVRGSAATYGFADVGAAAGQVEEILLRVDGSPDEATRALIDSALRRVEGMARAAAAASEAQR